MISITLLIIVAAVVALVFLFNSYQNKYQSFQGNIFNFIVVTLLIFLLLSIGYVYLSNGPNLASLEGVIAFFKAYYAWLVSFVDNSRGIVGYAVNQDWGVNSSVSK